MIKIENVDTYGWEAAIRGMRNPLNSWDKSDSLYQVYLPKDSESPSIYHDVLIGPNDLKLMKTLANAGNDHGKFLRMITVTADITAPLFWVAEHDTYKISTVRNSCSFMHKGVSKPFEIDDFSVQDERIPYLLNPIRKKFYDLVYSYETSEFRYFELENGRKYKVFKNGKVVSCEFSYTDSYGTGRTRNFPEKECKPSITNGGYYELNLGGRNGEKWMLHRLIATVWLKNPENLETVNHIDGNKGNNSVENLEWCSLADNIKMGFENGQYDVNKLHREYHAWKNGHTVVPPEVKHCMKNDYSNGLSTGEIAKKYDVPYRVTNNILCCKTSKNHGLFYYAYIWEKLIGTLNTLREAYLETKDESIFFEIRQMLPQGYNVRYTWQANYAVLRNIYHSRRNHRLPEWHTFCDWIRSLPYSELITGEEN